MHLPVKMWNECHDCAKKWLSIPENVASGITLVYMNPIYPEELFLTTTLGRAFLSCTFP